MKKYLLILAMLLGAVSMWGQDSGSQPRTVYNPNIIPTIKQAAPPAKSRLKSASTVVVLNFEGCPNVGAIGNYYNGGAGGSLGISFNGTALGLVNSSAGGSGNVGNCPSGVTTMFFLDGAAIMNIPAGFTTGFSFFYATAYTGTVRVYDGVDGTGTEIASGSFNPTPTPWYSFASMGVAFSGTAKSVKFDGVANQCCFDDITFGSISPGLPTNPADPTSISNPSGTICSGSDATLTAQGASTTVYWSTSACAGPYFSTGNPIVVHPTTTTTYYARNYNGEYSTGCASTTVYVNNPSSAPTSAAGTPSGTNTASLAFGGAAGTGTITYYWVVGTSSSVAYGSGGAGWYGSTTGTTASISVLSPSTTYYLRVYSSNGTCGNSAYFTSASFRTASVINYTAGAHGTLTGTTAQTIANAGTGSAVTAVPDANYHFVNWSDGSVSNPRTDVNVTNSLNVTANFAPNILVIGTQPVNSIAGIAIPVTVRITKTDGTTITSATNSVTLSIQNNAGSGTLSGTVTRAAVAGVATFNDISINKTGNGYTLKAVGDAPSIIVSQPISNPFNITPGAIDHFTVTGIADPVVAGTTTTPVVTAFDAYNNIKTNYTGTIQFSANTPHHAEEVLPSYTFLTGDNGVKSLLNGVTLKTTGERTVTVTGDNKTGAQTAITVTPAAISAFDLVANNNLPVTAGVSFSVVATVRDLYGNVKTNFVGENLLWTTTATPSLNGTARVLPANGPVTFTNGIATVSGFTLFNSHETPDITVTDGPSDRPGTHQDIVVKNNILENFLVEAGQAQKSGVPFNVKITARDVYWNTAIDYVGVARFKSSLDAVVAYPADYQFVASDYGVKTFTNGVTINPIGTYWVRAADADYAFKSGQQEGIIVGPGLMDPAHSTFTVDYSGRIAGQHVRVTVTPRDAMNNLLCPDATLLSVLLDGATSDYDGQIVENNVMDTQTIGGAKATGVYTADVRVTKTTVINKIEAYYGGVKLGEQVISVLPAVPSLANTTITRVPGTITTNENSTVTVQLYDMFDNLRTTNDGVVTLATDLGGFGGNGGPQSVAATYNGTTTGSYSATLYASYSATNHGVGTASISGSIDFNAAEGPGVYAATDVPVAYAASPWPTDGAITHPTTVVINEGLPNLTTSEITANPTSITTDGTSNVTVQLKDHLGNLIQNNRGTVTLSSTLGLLSAVTYDTNGKYKATLTGDTRPLRGTGTATITGSFAGTGTASGVSGAFADNTTTVDISEGAPAVAQITIDAAATTITADGSTVVTVQLKDQFGNLIVNDRGTVTLSTNLGVIYNGTTTGASDITANYNGSGSYIATFKMNGPGVGTATITGKYAGTAVSPAQDQVIVTPGAATHLGIHTQPSSTGNATAGVLFNAQPVIYILDQWNNLVTGDNSTVVTAARGTTGTSVLKSTGVLTAAASSGIATFAGLNYEKAENINVAFTSSPVLTSVTSSTFTVVHNTPELSCNYRKRNSNGGCSPVDYNHGL